MYTALPRLLADDTPGASRVWCVIPFDLGPERSAEACHIDDASWKLVDDERLQRAEIKLYVSTR